MSAESEFLLRLGNPFVNAMVSERDVYAREGPTLDVESIHAPAREALRHTIARLRAGHAPLLCIKGEAGDGKTHLLSWLRRQATSDKAGPFWFVALPPLGNAGELFRHALRHVVAALRREEQLFLQSDSHIKHPLDHLIWHTLRLQAIDLIDEARLGSYAGAQHIPSLLASLLGDPDEQTDTQAFARAAAPRWSEIEPELSRHMQGLPAESPIDGALRSVISRYPYKDRRGLCTAWLSCEPLGDKERTRLGVEGPLESEAAARRILIGLCRMSPVPLLICFDQLEHVADRLREPGLSALADLIAALHSEGDCGQVVACHAAVWPAFMEKLGSHHIEADQIVMQRLGPKEVHKLIEKRMEHAFQRGPRAPYPSYPFPEPDIERACAQHRLTSARQALRFFEGEFERRKEALRRPEAPPAPQADAQVEALAQVLARARARVREGMKGTLPGARVNSLRAVLKEICDALKQRGDDADGARLLGCDAILGGGLRIIIEPATARGLVVRAALEICNADMGPQVIGAATRVSRQVADGRAELALLLREQGLPIHTGVGRTSQTVEGLLGAGGSVVWLEPDDVIEALAIERVLQAASAGEITLEKPLGRAEVLHRLLATRDGDAPGLPRLLGLVLARMKEVKPQPPRATAQIPILSFTGTPALGAAGQRSTSQGLSALDSRGAARIFSPPDATPPASRPKETLAMMTVSPLQAATKELTHRQVMKAIGERTLVEEVLLARELGIAPEALAPLLAPLEREGLIRVTLSREGIKVVTRVAR